MNLHYPLVLLLLLAVPGLLYARYARRRRLSIRFSDGRTLARLPVGWAVRLAWVLPAAYTLGLTLLIIALARPQRGLDESRVRTEAVDIVLLVDVSTSMRAEDFSTATRRMNRLDAAKQVIERFIKNRPDDRIGLVAFSAMPYTVAPLTLDHNWLQVQVDRLETGMLEDGTAIGDALASAINRLRESRAVSKLVILLTDGMNNRGKLSPDNAAQAAKALGVKVYTIGAGTEGFAPYPVDNPFGGGTRYIRQPVEIDEAGLTRIADVTGGRYFRATDLKSLENIYEDIDAMEKTEMEVEQYTRFEDRFQPFLIAGLLLLGLEKLLSFTRLGRLP